MCSTFGSGGKRGFTGINNLLKQEKITSLKN